MSDSNRRREPNSAHFDDTKCFARAFADAGSLAECVVRILDDSKLRRELEAHAFKYGQEVGWTKVADQYGEIFRSAVWSQGTGGEATAVSEA